MRPVLRLSVNSALLRQDPSLATEVSLLRQQAGGHDNLRFPMESRIILDHAAIVLALVSESSSRKAWKRKVVSA